MNKLTKSFILFFVFICMKLSICNGQQVSSVNKINSHDNKSRISSMTTIDSGDSVMFDLINISVTGNLLSLPVYMISDDVINALDFKLKYNHSNLLFDSIQLISNCFDQTTFFESPFDSSIRFTSNSFQDYPSDTLLLNIYFDVLGGVYSDSDFYGQSGFLNGITCTAHLVVPPPLSLSELNLIPNLKLYPNPVIDKMQVKGEDLTAIDIFDVNGKKVISYLPESNFNSYNMDVSTLSQGNYIVKIYSRDLVAVKKIVVNK